MTAQAAAPFADAIVVAAGSSSRMGGIDKLSAVIGGLPILAHSLRAVAAAEEVRRIVVVTSEDRIAALGEAPWLPAKVEQLVAGGPRRQESVWAGVRHALLNKSRDGSDAEVFLIHDGARPLVSTELVSSVAQMSRVHGAAIPLLPVGDTIKRLAPDGTVAGVGDRAELGAAQTPQGIRSDLLRQAFDTFPADGEIEFTDEAALLEACTIPVHAIPGDERNFKVTLPADLERAELALGGRFASPGLGVGRTSTGASRVGFGSDSHPFGPGVGLALGGLVVDGAPHLSGHSDGDVLLHAVADALLGAAGLGDLGGMFPAGPETPRGVPSIELLEAVASRVRTAGWLVSSLDATIVAGRPRLGSWLGPIRDRVAALLQVDAACVNMKASSGNLDGMEGAGRGISAQVVVVLDRARSTGPSGS